METNFQIIDWLNKIDCGDDKLASVILWNNLLFY